MRLMNEFVKMRRVTVNKFECVLSAVIHEDPEIVPQTIRFQKCSGKESEKVVG